MRYSRFIFGSTLSLFALPALAAEPGTYRPGAPYYSTQAPSADTCERQCSGDAQCKGWNFVAVNPQAAGGVCEFNSQNVSPVPSDISTSGSNGAPSYSRRVATGATSTVRVGTPEPARRSAPIASRNVIPARAPSAVRPSPRQDITSVRPGARAIRSGQTAPSRRIIRQPVSARMQPQQGAYTAPGKIAPMPYAARSAQRPRFQHSLDGNPQNYASPRPAQAPVVPAARKQRSPQNFQGGDPRLQNMLRQNRAQPSSQAAPVQAQAPRPAPLAQKMAPPQPLAQTSGTPQRPMSLAEAEQSLFGSLNDDVKMPKAMTAAEQNNPDGPIATVASVPVKKITAESLMGLAGAPNQ